MPRRLPVRPAKVFGNFFVLIVLSVMALIYYSFVFVLYGPRAEKDPKILALLIVYNFLFLMLVWSFFQAMTTDPGQVPVFWGFHLGDNENKRRRYCLMCNVFKPERCHHCSACNRCVLNMDHHCPWINNCVGFWNRKYFLLLLVYVLIMTYLTFALTAYDFYNTILWGINNKIFSSNDPKLGEKLIIMFAFMMNFIVLTLMTAFLKFHLMLASENKTTIENLDKFGKPFQSVYDVGSKENWKQIFGTNSWLYPFPIFCGSGKPVGDGIYWPTIQSQQELAQRQSQMAAERAAQSQVNQPLNNSLSQNQRIGQQNNQQFALGQQFNNRQQNQNFPPNMVTSQNKNNVQMIGDQKSNVIMMNQQQQNDNAAGVGNSRKELNQRIFQNQGRAFQLQQQLQLQQQQQLQQMQQQQMQYRGGSANSGAQQVSQTNNASVGNRGGAQASSGMVNPKRRRAPGDGQSNNASQQNLNNAASNLSVGQRKGSNQYSASGSQQNNRAFK